MSTTNSADPIWPKTPWHLWLVGILALLWNGSGAVTILIVAIAVLELGYARGLRNRAILR